MIHYPNKDDYLESFWIHNYKILVSAQGIEFCVNAACEQDALDYVIDYCEEFLPGLLWPRKEAVTDEFISEYICGGNHGRYLSTHNIHIEELHNG